MTRNEMNKIELLRWVRHFKAGDFIEVKVLFGRVTERGLFHSEIQNEEHDLINFERGYPWIADASASSQN
jgi:hypothetical protein